MPKMEIRIGMGGEGEGSEEMSDYEEGFYDCKDQMIAAVGMHRLKASDAEAARNELLKLLDKVECEGMDQAPPSRPSGAGMADSESEYD